VHDFYMAHCEKYVELKTHIPCINCNFSSLSVGKTWQLLDFSGGLPLTSSVTCYGFSEHCGSAIVFSELHELLASVFTEIMFKSIPQRLRYAISQYSKGNLWKPRPWKGPHNVPFHYQRKFVSFQSIPTTSSKY
jgi:hypothetical protein